MSTLTPRQAVEALQSRPTLPDGNDERFTGYGVLGVPFESGHYLALRDMVANSIGPAYRAIWHRDPSGRWTIHTTGEPHLSCPRYFGAATASVRVPRIDVAWRDDSTLQVSLGDELDWQIDLRSSLATRMMTAMAGVMPAPAWTNHGVLTAMGPIATGLLQAGRMTLLGATPNGHDFKAAPVKVWRVGGRATLRGADLGGPAPLADQTGLGDFWLPQRGLFFVGNARFSAMGEPASTTGNPAEATMGR